MAVLDIPWLHAFWADQPGFTPPADGAVLPVAPDDLGSDATAIPNGLWGRRPDASGPKWVANIGTSGRPGLSLVGSGGIEKSSGLTTQAVRSIVIVGRVLGADGDLFDSMGGRSLVDTSGGQWRLFSGSVLAGGTADTDLHLFIAEFDAAGDDSLDIDSVNLGSGNAGTDSASGGITVGNTPGNPSGNVDGVEVAFVGFIGRALTAQEKTDLWTWYQADYLGGSGGGIRNLKIGSQNVSRLYDGSTQLTRLYIGSQLVFEE